MSILSSYSKSNDMCKNTLGKMWIKFLRPFETLTLEFENKELKGYGTSPEMETFNRDVVVKVIGDLIEQKMITFFDDIPKMTIIVEIHDIPSISEYKGVDPEMVYIETFHYNDENDEMIDRDDCDVPKPLHEFMGISTPVTLVDI